MVKVTTKKTIDMGALDFEDFGDAKKLKYDSKTIKLDYWSGRQDRFEGSFSYNVASKTVSGTAKKWAQYNWHSKQLRWSMTDIALSAGAVLKAAKTNAGAGGFREVPPSNAVAPHIASASVDTRTTQTCAPPSS